METQRRHSAQRRADVVHGRVRTLQEKMRHLFRVFDTSFTGRIDAEELCLLLADMGIRLSEAELEAALRYMNRRGDRSVLFFYC